MRYCLFEDSDVNNFYPIILTKHLSSVLVGANTQFDRLKKIISSNSNIVLFGREYLTGIYDNVAPYYSSAISVPNSIFINSKVFLSNELFNSFPTSNNWVFIQDKVIVAFNVDEDIKKLIVNSNFDFSIISSLKNQQIINSPLCKIYNYLWDFIEDNSNAINHDRSLYNLKSNDKFIETIKINENDILFGADCNIGNGVILDASSGVILIGNNVTIMHNSVIIGPCYIGDNSVLKVGTKIYENCSLGDYCKIGGEVENTIILGYSNKQHDGFLGHSYIGEWVNLGADTNTSDLKNNYGEIKVQLNNKTVNTGRLLLGSLIGDHSKTSINTMLNTGTIIGVFANIFGSNFPNKNVNSFAWGMDESFKFRKDDAIQLAKIVMKRRNIETTDNYVKLIDYLYEHY